MESLRASGARWPATRRCERPRRTATWLSETIQALYGGPIGTRNNVTYMSERVLKVRGAGHC
eukprot:1913025-Pyramimonas_sp.AAC.1